MTVPDPEFIAKSRLPLRDPAKEELPVTVRVAKAPLFVTIAIPCPSVLFSEVRLWLKPERFKAFVCVVSLLPPNVRDELDEIALAVPRFMVDPPCRVVVPV